MEAQAQVAVDRMSAELRTPGERRARREDAEHEGLRDDVSWGVSRAGTVHTASGTGLALNKSCPKATIDWRMLY